jgi:tetratricopeptide (TPR) repeat protein
VSALLCEGDTSEALIRQAWESLDAGKGGLGVEKLEKALACTKVAIDTFAAQADEQQARRLQANECRVPPGVNDKEAYFRLYAALSDVGAAWFIRGQVFSQQQNWKEAREAYKMVVDKYSCAYAWDARGWFWRIAEGAEREMKKLP